MEKTPLGLTRLAPGEPLSSDNYAFQDLDPLIIDGLLRYAAYGHRHDGHAALANPVLDLVAAIADAGGAIPADTTIFVGYTLVDADGGETTLNDTQTTVSTRPSLAPPDVAPTATVDHAAGTLVAGTYTYAVTITDDGAGETALGPVASVVVPTGQAANQIAVTDLDDLVTAVGGTGYRLWRRVNGGAWGLIADGATPNVTDDGSLCVDCTQAPPTRTGKTNGTSKLTVTVPAPQGAEATLFRIYASTDGTFSNPSLLGTYPVAELGQAKTFNTLALLDGAPPEVSRTFQGADPIDAETELAGLRWRAPVASVAALPAAANTNGDVRLALNERTMHLWTGANWQPILPPPITRQAVGFQQAGMANGAVAEADIAMPKSYRLMKLVSAIDARVQVYITAGHRTADLGRPGAVPPAGPSHGVVVDAEVNANETLTFTPSLDGWNDDPAPQDIGYIRVTALAAGDADVQFTLIRTEV